MTKLALIGKNISHSQSPRVYRALLQRQVDYQLLDFVNADEIPTAEELMNLYQGVSITAPYKTHFWGKIPTPLIPTELNAINCLYRDGSAILGANTDLLALQDLLPSHLKNYLQIYLLGDGSMSKVVSYVLNNNSASYTQLSRNKGNLYEAEYLPNSLIINCCHRDFDFKGKLGVESLFWDMNYAHSHNQHAIESQNITYLDGQSLLILQAKYALKLWQIN